VKNEFLTELVERSARQVPFTEEERPEEGFTTFFETGRGGRGVWLRPADWLKVEAWREAGFTQPMRTPDQTLIFVTPEKAREIRRDQADCMGCLSHCLFSNWKDHDDYTTGRLPDPRSFCIQKTLQDIAHGRGRPAHQQLMFAGHNAFRFRTDPFYANGFVPTVRQLVQRILTGA
jgi:hypothetical protein